MTASKARQSMVRRSRPAAEFFAMTDSQKVANAAARAKMGERLSLDQGGPQLRQLAFVNGGILAIEQVGDDEIENGVAEEFEPFIVARVAFALVFIDERAMRERLGQQV